MQYERDDDTRTILEMLRTENEDLRKTNKKLLEELKKIKKNLRFDEMTELHKRVKILTDTALELEEVNKMLKEENRILSKDVAV
jgi:hypothetical protein